MKYTHLQIRLALTCLAILSFLLVVTGTCADDTASPSFLPTWKLLNQNQKEQFVAGYLQGFVDAAKLTHVTAEFVEENPQKIKESLNALRKIYDTQGLSPLDVTSFLDRYYQDPDHSRAPLSAAVSAARADLRR